MGGTLATEAWAMMRKIAVINPTTQSVIYKTVPDEDISRAAGPELDRHSVVARSDDTKYGLFSNATTHPAPEPEYFALNGALCHGTAVLYAFDGQGRTLNISKKLHPKPMWLGDANTVRVAVVNGLVDKPKGWDC